MSISPKELLKGCIVSYEGQPRIVKGVMDYIILEGTKEWIGGSLMTGEPISEVWLDRFGFIKDKNGWYMPRTQFSLTDLFYPCWMDKMLWPKDVTNFKHLSIEYVHQLQCLFFSLNGEHLQLPKLPKK